MDTGVMSDSSLPVARQARFRVLTVCTGNLYRSPVAECLLRQRLAPLLEAIHVSSAGTAAAPGVPVEGTAASLLGTAVDLPGTVTRRLTAGLVESADLVLGAATEHREAAVRLSPVRALSRAFSLREFARLVRAEDAAGLVDPAVRLTALVKGAAARRGSAGEDVSDDDVNDPLGASPSEVRDVFRRIEESVDRIAAVLLAC